MATDVDICNLALSHIGDVSNIQSVSPPDGSAQAAHCARFYPVARDALIESHNWSFAVKYLQLAELTNDRTEWDYKYGLPADMLNAISIASLGQTDDTSVATGGVPQPFSIEADAAGNLVLYTDIETAVLRYTRKDISAGVFPPLFVMALSWKLGALLAGPVVRGEAGTAAAKHCEGMAAMYQNNAKIADSNKRQVKVEHIPTWIANR